MKQYTVNFWIQRPSDKLWAAEKISFFSPSLQAAKFAWKSIYWEEVLAKSIKLISVQPTFTN